MISDKLNNLSFYKFPKEVVDFVNNLSSETALGKYVISDDIYANVEEYFTKEVTNAKFESHKKYLDIQILLKGKEKISYAPVDELNILQNYDENRDIVFYSDNVENVPYITLDGSNFVVLFPHEAHAPQISLNESMKVLKVVVKMKITS
ncbi:YhcH/YjgK/YiaL family protein [bacterium]|nr:YhcH/YjgK/YiaL family protein [bacterium]